MADVFDTVAEQDVFDIVEIPKEDTLTLSAEDSGKLNQSIKFSRQLGITPSEAFDLHDELIKEQKSRIAQESLKHEGTKLALGEKVSLLSPEAQMIIEGKAAFDPLGIRGLAESALHIGASITSFLLSFPVGIAEFNRQYETNDFNVSKIRDAMEKTQRLPEKAYDMFPALQSKTLSGKQWPEVFAIPFQVYFERGVEPVGEWLAEKFGDSDENKQQIRDATKIVGDTALLIAPAIAKRGKAALFKSEFYRKATVKERGLMILDYEDLRNKGYSEAELARMNPEFFKRALEKRKATLKDEELAAVEGKPVEQVIKEREKTKLSEKLTEEEVIAQAKEIEAQTGKTPRLEGEQALPIGSIPPLKIPAEQKKLGQLAEDFARMSEPVKTTPPKSQAALEAQTPPDVSEADINEIVFKGRSYDTTANFTVSTKNKPGFGKDIISHMIEGVQAGEAGKRTSYFDTEQNKTVPLITPSTFPKWFQNKGYTKKNVIAILSKVKEGKVLTEKQQAIFNDLFEGAAKEYYDHVGDQPVLIDIIRNNQLKPGDKITLDVKDVHTIEGADDAGNIILKNDATGKEMKLDVFEDERGRVTSIEKTTIGEKADPKLVKKFFDAIEKGLKKEKPKGQKLKTFIRKTIGEAKVSDLVQESEALKGAMNAAVRAAREAFRAGNKEGVAKERLRLKQLAAKAKARQDVRKQIAKIVSDLKDVKKKLPKMNEAFRDPVNDLLEGIDLVRLGQKKKLRLEKLRDIVNDDSENGLKVQEQLSDKMRNNLKRLDKWNIGDMTFDELQEIHDTVMHLTHLDQLKKSIIYKQKKQAVDEVVDAAINEMKPVNEIAQKGIESEGKNRFSLTGRAGKYLKQTFGIRMDRYDLMIETIAGPNSVMHRIFYRAMNKVKDREIFEYRRFYDEFYDALGNFQEKFQIPEIETWLEEKIPVLKGKFNLSRNERMALYRHSLNNDNRAALIEGGFGFRKPGRDTGATPNTVFEVTEKELDSIINAMTAAERFFAGDPVTKLYLDMGERYNEVFVIMNGYSMPLIDNYYLKDVMPAGRKVDNRTIEAETALDQFRGKWSKVGVNKDRLRERVGSKAPIYLNSLTYDLNKTIREAAAYIALEEATNNASKLLYNRKFRSELESRYGQELWKEIENGIRDMVGDYKGFTSVDSLLMQGKNLVATAFLGINPYVMILQTASFPLYNIWVESKYLTKGFINYQSHRKDIIEKHKANSIKFLERFESGYSRDIKDIYASTSERRLYKGKKSVAAKTMFGIQKFDIEAVAPGMEGAVLKVLDEIQNGKLSDVVKEALDINEINLSELQPEEKLAMAYEFADWVTKNGQPMFDAQHLSSLQRGSVPEKLATMYGSATNTFQSQLRRAYRGLERENHPDKWKIFAKTLFYLFVVNGIVATGLDLIRDKLRGKEITARNVLLTYLQNEAGLWFFVRDIAGAAISAIKAGSIYRGFDVNLPIQRPVQYIADFLTLTWLTAEEAIDGNWKKAEDNFIDAMDKGLAITMTRFGLPYATPKRFAQDIGLLPKKKKKKKSSKPVF